MKRGGAADDEVEMLGTNIQMSDELLPQRQRCRCSAKIVECIGTEVRQYGTWYLSKLNKTETVRIDLGLPDIILY